MQQPMFTFDADSAKTSGPGGATETGAYTGTIRQALFTTGQNSQSESLELSLDSDVGVINYLRIPFVGREGNPLKSGTAMINAIMGLTQTKQLFATEVTTENGTGLHCKELEGKPIGLVLQKVLYTKNDGGDGYKFEIRQAFGLKTRKTYKEAMENLPAEAVGKLLSSLSDRDERQKAPGGMNQNQWANANGQPQSRLQQAATIHHQQMQQVPDDDEEIPF